MHHFVPGFVRYSNIVADRTPLDALVVACRSSTGVVLWRNTNPTPVVF